MSIRHALLIPAAFLIPSLAQQTAAAQSDAGGIAANPSGQIRLEGPARAAAIRRDWLASHHGQGLPPLTPPSLTSGKIHVRTFDVASPPAAPKVTFDFQTGNSGIKSIAFYFHPASSNGQSLYVSHNVTYNSPAVTHGSWTLEDPVDSAGYGAFNLYSGPGKWILDNAYIYDQAGNYTYYNATDLAGIFGCPGSTGCITVKLTNNGTPDVKPPVIKAAKVLTPKVSLASDPPSFAASLTVADNLSGVDYTWIEVCPPNGSGGNCFDYTNYTMQPLLSGKVTDYNWVCDATGKCSTTPTGTWTIYAFGICDVARNCNSDYSATDIANLFGTTTFKVTP